MVIIVVFSEFFSIVSDGVHHGDIIFTPKKAMNVLSGGLFWG